MSEYDLTPDEKAELRAYLDSEAPKQEEKYGIYNFFNKIFKTKNTTKVSNLDENEINAIRTMQNAANYANTMGLDQVRDYLNNKAEIILGSALSKQGFFINAAITTKSEKKLRTKAAGAVNKSWFKKNQSPEVD